MAQQEYYQKLVEQIKDWDYYYHVLDNPKVSDADYDRAYQELLKLEKEHPDWVVVDSPTQRVGGEPLKQFFKAKHEFPLLSLNNIYNEGELHDFIDRVSRNLPAGKQVSWFCETKFDGLSLAITYEGGRLLRAVTRGDGSNGEDVTANVQTIRSLPSKISFLKKLSLRAEALIPRLEFERIIKEQAEAGQREFANPRNAAAGTIRQLDPKVAESRKLKVFVYEILNAKELDIKTHEEAIELLKREKFLTDANGKACADALEIQAFYEKILVARPDLAYDIDGIVIKLQDLASQELLGITGKAPRWACAYKYPPLQAKTKIANIFVQVGRTGVLTPVAEFEPVFLAGSTVRFASLHNWEEMREKDIRIGDFVLIEKAGDIIPQVVRVLPEMRHGGETLLPIPHQCPVCASPVSQNDSEVAIRCNNLSCHSRLLGNLKHFVSRDALDIAGIGESVLTQLLEMGKLKTPIDLFFLSVDDFLALKETREKLATKLFLSIKARQKVELSRYLYGLGIPHVGVTVARVLARHFKSLKMLEMAEIEALTEVSGLGNVMAEAVYDFFRSPLYLEMEDQRAKSSLEVLDVVETQKVDGPLSGQILCFTGTLSRMGRAQASEYAARLGAQTTDSVTKQTTMLVYGEKAGSKLAKAEKLGISVLSEEEFFGTYPGGMN
ncbi:MAG: NAD-dependent DNA ligase LigA [Candidatus Cloacimonetes bacterium]|nr:NAD-dependent DNA ligase LigA [Candidatus Cloacimonadota bacterium]